MTMSTCDHRAPRRRMFADSAASLPIQQLRWAEWAVARCRGRRGSRTVRDSTGTAPSPCAGRLVAYTPFLRARPDSPLDRRTRRHPRRERHPSLDGGSEARDGPQLINRQQLAQEGSRFQQRQTLADAAPSTGPESREALRRRRDAATDGAELSGLNEATSAPQTSGNLFRGKTAMILALRDRFLCPPVHDGSSTRRPVTMGMTG